MSECQEATSKIEISPGDLGHLRVLRKFLDHLTEAQEQLGSHPSFDDPKRKLRLSDYLGLMLLGLLNPVAGTLRGMSAASRIRKIQKDVCRKPASLGSLSEAQGLVDVALLEKVFSDISAEAMVGHRVTLGEDARRVFRWMAHDGSIIPALDRMTWALYGGGRDGSTRAVRLHLSLDIASDCPVAASVTEGKTCERGQLRLDLEPGGAYILDRLYYGQQHKFFGDLQEAGCSYIARIKEVTTLGLIEELPVTEADAAAGVEWQACARLGSKRYRSVGAARRPRAGRERRPAGAGDKPRRRQTTSGRRGKTLQAALAG